MAWLWERGRPTLLAAVGLGLVGYKALQWLRQEDLQGQVVLITGSSRGLGLALAREFARHCFLPPEGGSHPWYG